MEYQYINSIMKTAEESKSNDLYIRQQYDNVIKQTRKLIKDMTEQQRFQKAKSHVMDALYSRQPRPLSHSPQLSQLYYILYYVQTSWVWQWTTFFISFTYMYLVILDNQSYVQKISIEASLLFFLLLDLIMDFYIKSFDRLTIKTKYPKIYYYKAFSFFLMLTDLIVFIVLPCYNSRPIRPFRLLRVFLPVLYDTQIRKSLIALVSAFRQFITYMVYFSIIIVIFGLIGSQTLTFDPQFVDPRYPNIPYKADPYLNNYNNFSRMIYHMYGVATYDFFPDFQTLATQNYQPNYIFYAVFVFLNMFLFASIPGAVIYNKFRQTRSRYILVDEIKQQHSLILAFVTLAKQDSNLSMQQLVKFLFDFYRKKARYIEFITQICLKLDDNNNQTIQVNQFMQLSKILLNNSVMFPPTFNDVQFWITFRKLINENLSLEDIVQHWLFDFIISLIILLCAINGFFLLNTKNTLNQTFDTFFIWLFFVELLVRLVAIGPQKYFAYRWNNIDSFLITLNVIFYFITLNSNIDNLFKINRIFRVAFLFRTLLFSQTASSLKLQIIEKIKRLFQTFVQIFPIITRFFLIFSLIFFFFGILGMQIFFNTQEETNYEPKYIDYIQFSNYKTFIHSQNIMMQILTEGGWTKVAYNYCWRNQDYYGLILTYFMIMHFVIVYVFGTLLKGIFWQIYFSVSSILDQIDQKESNQIEKEEENNKKSRQIYQINQQINNQQVFQAETILKREIIEMKMDIEILKRIKSFEVSVYELRRVSQRSIRSISRSKIVQKMIQTWNIDANQLQVPKLGRQSIFSPRLKRKRAMQFQSLEDKEEQDFHKQMQELLNRLIISPKMKFSQIIAYPEPFVTFLNSKFKEPKIFIGNNFDIDLNPLYNQDSMNFHIYQLSSLIQLQVAQRKKKQIIVECLINNSLIDQNLAQKIVKSRLIIKKFHIDRNGALRKMLLSQTNQDLVKKLETQYFSDVYGNAFKQINKVTLQPLLKVQSLLLSTLWNILSYSQIHHTNFFHLLTHIQDQISNQLLKKGSLFKFVYKLSLESDIWFQIQHKSFQPVEIRFTKTGLWCFTQEMYENHIYYARDIFNCQNQENISQRTSMLDEKVVEQYMKLFYQSFETLAFSLIDKNPFFENNPKNFVYDLYLNNFEVPSSCESNSSSQKLKISNIMVIILSKQEQRKDIGQQSLPYQISDIITTKRKQKKQDFLLEDQQKETFQKLKNLSAIDHEKIIQSQGLPFSYIINMMQQISDIFKLYGGNFKQQVQSAFNTKYNEIQNNFSSEIQIGGEKELLKQKPTELSKRINILY